MQRRKKQNEIYKMLLMAFGILIVTLIVVLILLLAGVGTSAEQREANLLENGHFMKGVSVEGVDLSGQTMEQALANETLVSLAQQMETGFTYTFTAGSIQYTYSASELGITSSLQQTLQQAMVYGQLGDGETLREQQVQAQQSGYDFKLGMHADEAIVLEKITALKPSMDTLPQDAALNIRDDVQGDGRFEYIDAVTGVDIDATAFSKLICEKINSGDNGVVEAPAIITNPKIAIETLKANTKKYGDGYTSSFKGGSLDDPDRVTNIRIMAGIVNGTVIQPGETWSINDAAGPRDDNTAKTVGWAYAPGIADGKYRMEVGGGVCQVSSTLYNAAIRAELTIVDRKPHSWPSHYIPEGLDATISTGSPDLKISNPYDMPIYIETVLDEEEKTLTVNIYGPPLTHGYTIDFENKKVAYEPAPDPIYHYNATVDKEGVAIEAGKEVVWKESHPSQTWDVYKVYKDADGNVVKRDSEPFTHNVYKSFQGEVYANYSDPASGPVESPAQ